MSYFLRYRQVFAKWDESDHPRGKTTPQSNDGSFRRKTDVDWYEPTDRIKEGAILHTSWGYDEKEPKFYEVVRRDRDSKTKVYVRQMEIEVDPKTKRAVPVKGRYRGEEMKTRRYGPFGWMDFKRSPSDTELPEHKYATPHIKLSGHLRAWLWDGRSVFAGA